jgi:hypothetical protein
MKKLLILLALLSLMLAACGDKDKDDDDDKDDDKATATTGDTDTDGDTGGTGDIAADAETALVALVSGKPAEAASYFCEADAQGLEAVASGFPAPMEGAEYSADCTSEGETVNCSLKLTVSGIETPSGDYTFNVVDGKICNMQAAAQ